MRFISYHEIEQRFIGDGVRAVIVDEFSMGDFISSRTWVASTEDLKVCFNLLVNTFHFTIRLGVVDSREGDVVVEEFAKFFDKSGGKL